jgi:hypothetical protein
LNPDEIRAAAETHRELGPEYQTAVIESFLDKVGREIDARVDQRMAIRPIRPQRGRSPMALAITSMALGIPLTGIVLGIEGSGKAGLLALAVVWVAITAINLAYTLSGRSEPPPRR